MWKDIIVHHSWWASHSWAQKANKGWQKNCTSGRILPVYIATLHSKAKSPMSRSWASTERPVSMRLMARSSCALSFLGWSSGRTPYSVRVWMLHSKGRCCRACCDLDNTDIAVLIAEIYIQYLNSTSSNHFNGPSPVMDCTLDGKHKSCTRPDKNWLPV